MFAKLSIAAIAVSLFTATFTGDLLAETKINKRETSATRGQVAAACEAAGGIGWGYGADKGRYGCITDNSYIECDDNGSCEGGTVTEESRRPRGGHGVYGGTVGTFQGGAQPATRWQPRRPRLGYQPAEIIAPNNVFTVPAYRR